MPGSSLPRLGPAHEAPGHALCALLQDAFSTHDGALHYTPTVLRTLLDGGVDASASRVARVGARPVGLVVARARRLAGAGPPLKALHLGPLAVDPGRWRQGLGTQLMNEVEAQARDMDVDLLTLTTLAEGDAARLYLRLGYALIEAAAPRVWSGGRAPVPPPPRPWPVDWPPAAPRVGALIEQGPLPARVPEGLLPRWVQLDGGSLCSLVWPVLRGRGRGRAAQIVACDHPHPRLLAAAWARARADGAELLWALPGVVEGVEGVTPSEPVSWRMAKPLSPSGAAAMAAATRYIPLGICG